MSQSPQRKDSQRAWLSARTKIVLIWSVTIVLLLLRRFEVIDWSAWIIVTPVLMLIGIIAIPLGIVIWIGVWRGLKIRIVNTLGHR